MINLLPVWEENPTLGLRPMAPGVFLGSSLETLMRVIYIRSLDFSLHPTDSHIRAICIRIGNTPSIGLRAFLDVKKEWVDGRHATYREVIAHQFARWE